MKKLPIGISTLSKIRSDTYYYVDKTVFVKMLLDGGHYYFLSRPRRFGKSLFVDTLREAFSGNRDLFKGLYLENNWDWDTKYPVIHVSFGGGVIDSRSDLEEKLIYILDDNARKYEISFEYHSVRDRFSELIRKLAEKYRNPVVVLVDEYDKPILDNITTPEKAAEIQEGLKNFYSVIKDSDAHIKFCLLTGVSKFSKVSLFSGLNNLEDITLSPDFASICGYTESELISVFKDRLEGQPLPEIKAWYNGYNFNGETVYNPFDELLYLRNYIFGNYWFETATPTFLIKLLKERKYYLPDLEKLQVGENILGSFDVEDLVVETLLFQTGYLTIKNLETLGYRRMFTLTFPNREVRLSLFDYILDHYIQDIPAKSKAQTDVYRALMSGDMPSVKDNIFKMFAAIPHDWYRKNDIDKYEGYYASVVYACLCSLGFDLIAEDTTNHGRIDLTLFTESCIYIIEFKVNELIAEKTTALEQIKSKKYHEKYLNQFKEIYRIGMDFSRKERNIVRFEWDVIVNKPEFS